jgi:hypothetical protein
MSQLPPNITSDLADVKTWVMNSIASPNQFSEAYKALQGGRTAAAIDAWMACCETLCHASTYKAYYPRANRHLDREDLLQHGRMAATEILNKVAEKDVREPIKYAWTSIKREIHRAAFGKPRQCPCRVNGICQFACDCRERLDINCDCSCQCKCHRRTVSNFTNHFGDGDYDPIDRLAGEGVALRERVEDILCFCTNQIQRDVVIAIAEAIEDGRRPNSIYLTLNYLEKQIADAWKAVASHYLKVMVERGESLPGRPGGNQRRPPAKLRIAA